MASRREWQVRAQNKYDKKIARLSIRCSKELQARIAGLVKDGKIESLNKFVVAAIKEKLNRDFGEDD